MDIRKRIFAGTLKREMTKEMEKQIKEGPAWDEIQPTLNEHEKLMIKYENNETEQTIRTMVLFLAIMKGHDQKTRDILIKTITKVKGGMGDE